METRKLEVFLAVAEERSFTRAAERLHIVQSGVSTSVRSLERELGTPLFDRMAQRITLTEAGRALAPEARRVLAAVRHARQAVQEAGGGLRGTLELGVLFGVTPDHIRESLAVFRERFPMVDIRLRAPEARGAAGHIERLRDGSMDLAVLITIGTVPGIDLYPLTDGEVVLACPPGHRLADAPSIGLHDVVEETFIDFPPGWGVRGAVDRAFVTAGIQQRHITFETGDMSSILDLVRLRAGIAFVPVPITADVKDLRFVPVRPRPPTYQIALAASRVRRPSPVSRQFLRTVLASDDDTAAAAWRRRRGAHTDE
ncbi:LysR family transcriptional regulator [Actinoallomurus sp. CA-142502]|uniref:LysR family transcriptional regulator n=1 Tax=Actinoallomurus sp. CA-142502 TaxID=3239885 RepID=UPI003D8ED034